MSAPALLAEVVRGDLVESEHRGHLVVLDAGGGAVLEAGSPDAVVWPRSTLKPVQALALLRAGLEIDDEGLALACASHSGTAQHLEVVRGVLARVGLDETHLRNTPDAPLDAEAARAWWRAGREPSPLAQNCSGKHAAMLATCVAAGWATDGYLDPDHPLQQAVRATVAELTAVPVEHVTVDGCGAPLLSSTTRGLARAFARIAAAPAARPGSPEARVARAMTTRPDLVGGPGRDVTELMRAVPGLVAKDGAEGVYAAGLPDGGAVGLKVADGASRARAPIMTAALGLLLGDAAVRDRLADVGHVPVLGHGVPVGHVRAVLDAPRGQVVPGVPDARGEQQGGRA
ncbi:asparaginase [Cellulomonas sp. APG4]|uniref:asparaginase n=1 Tax=Cellulomonas sp. APG4 TaxID=1538656 RepID=UPI00351B73D8